MRAWCSFRTPCTSHGRPVPSGSPRPDQVRCCFTVPSTNLLHSTGPRTQGPRKASSCCRAPYTSRQPSRRSRSQGQGKAWCCSRAPYIGRRHLPQLDLPLDGSVGGMSDACRRCRSRCRSPAGAKAIVLLSPSPPLEAEIRFYIIFLISLSQPVFFLMVLLVFYGEELNQRYIFISTYIKTCYTGFYFVE